MRHADCSCSQNNGLFLVVPTQAVSVVVIKHNVLPTRQQQSMDFAGSRASMLGSLALVEPVVQVLYVSVLAALLYPCVLFEGGKSIPTFGRAK